jgi:hypothetical protein
MKSTSISIKNIEQGTDEYRIMKWSAVADHFFYADRLKISVA